MGPQLLDCFLPLFQNMNLPENVSFEMKFHKIGSCWKKEEQDIHIQDPAFTDQSASSISSSNTWGQCRDFESIFAKKICEKLAILTLNACDNH
jgi:hypothetical protein